MLLNSIFKLLSAFLNLAVFFVTAFLKVREGQLNAVDFFNIANRWMH